MLQLRLMLQGLAGLMVEYVDMRHQALQHGVKVACACCCFGKFFTWQAGRTPMVYAAASLTLPVHVFQVRTRTSYVDTISDPTLFAFDLVFFFSLFTRHAPVLMCLSTEIRNCVSTHRQLSTHFSMLASGDHHNLI